MVINKSAFLVLIFAVLFSFGLLCSAASARRTEQDPRVQYEQCQRRCQWETRGEREQEQCERSCERQYQKQQQQGREEERGRRSHDMNPEEPQRRYEECQQRCEQQEQRQQPQCQQRCMRQFEEQQRQQQQCQEHCEREGQGQGRHEQQQCQRKCQQQSEEQQQREQEQQSRKQYQECQQRCQQQEQRPEEKQQCQRQCRELYEEQGNESRKQSRRGEQEEEEEEEEGEQQRNSPYYFPHRRSFQTRFRDEEGNFKVLQRFAENSPLLKGINDYRFAMIEANPNAFVLPHHCDAEKIYFVTKGKGTITFVTHENKESYNVERGTVVRIPAGSTVYMVNQDNKEKLTIAMLALPVNTPGKSQEFFPAGNQNPQSYYEAFSTEILETVFNTQREQLEKLFEGQRRGQRGQRGQQSMFRRAKSEQIRAMSQQATSPRVRGGERLAINLLSQTPVYSNQNGRFFEVCPDEFNELRNMDVSVSACKINQGAIFVPHYNSKATFVVLVTEGNGYVEMACPHLPRQSQGSQHRREQQEEEEEEEGQKTGEIKKVKARLSPGDIFVVPAGHPATFVASRNQNLQTVGFGINAQNNQRIFLAGKKNMMRQMDSEAKELSFGVPSKLVDEIFNNPQESYFMSSSQQRQRGSEESRDNPIASFLDFVRLF